MPEAAQIPVTRIFITCDSSPLGAAALDAATVLARRLNAELAGLFVENSNLLRLAELPFAREYALLSAVARRLEAGEIVRAMHVQADAARGALSHAAQTLSLPWSFQVVRGTLLDSVLKAMCEFDLAVFGHTGQYVVSVDTRKGSPTRRSLATMAPQPIITIFDESHAAERALAAATLLAQVHQTSVVVLLFAEDASVLSRLRSRAALQLGKSHIAARFQELPSRDIRTILKVTDGSRAAALLWHGVQTLDDRKALATLVDALKCPVVLVS